jgi:hypothetical protein
MGEVRELLGEPDIARGGNPFRYKVDIGYRWGIQPRLFDLVVRFDKGDRVWQVAIETAE